MSDSTSKYDATTTLPSTRLTPQDLSELARLLIRYVYGQSPTSSVDMDVDCHIGFKDAYHISSRDPEVFKLITERERRREVRSMRIVVGTFLTRRIEVGLSRWGQGGQYCEVQGQDAQWVTDVMAVVTRFLMDRSPSFWKLDPFMKRGPLLAVLYLALIAAFSGLMVAASYLFTGDPFFGVSFGFTPLYVFASVGLTHLTLEMLLQILPRFDIEGGYSRRTAYLWLLRTAFVLFVAPFLVGIILRLV